MSKLKTRRVWLATLIVGLAILLFSAASWCRLMSPPAMADVRELSERAPFVFRGHVLTVIPTTANTTPGTRGEFIAKIQVDRWYRGKGPTETSLRFAYSGEIFRN